MINKSTLIHSLRLCVATSIAAIFGDFFNAGHMYWIMFTVVLVIQNEIGSSIKRSSERFFGTLIGAPLGLIIILTIGEYNHIALEIAAVIFAILMVIVAPKAYGIAALFLTAAIMIVYVLTGNLNIAETAINRISDTLLGTLIAIFVSMVVFPVSLSKIINDEFKKFLRLSGDAYQNITDSFCDETKNRFNMEKINFFDTSNRIIKEINEAGWEPAIIFSSNSCNEHFIANTIIELSNKFIEMSGLLNKEVKINDNTKQKIGTLANEIKTSFYNLAEGKTLSGDIKALLVDTQNNIMQNCKDELDWNQIVKISAFFELTQDLVEIVISINSQNATAATK